MVVSLSATLRAPLEHVFCSCVPEREEKENAISERFGEGKQIETHEGHVHLARGAPRVGGGASRRDRSSGLVEDSRFDGDTRRRSGEEFSRGGSLGGEANNLRRGLAWCCCSRDIAEDGRFKGELLGDGLGDGRSDEGVHNCRSCGRCLAVADRRARL